MSLPLTRDQITALEERHLAFLDERLTSPAAEAEWKANLPVGFMALLVQKVGDVIDANALANALDAALTSESVERLARPLAGRITKLVLEELGADKTRLGDHVPAAARKKIDALLERPGLIPERLLREIVEQDVIDEIMRDVLYDGLKEFSEKVNPFTAEWGIPSLLKRFSPFGVSKGFDGVRAEFDRRLEPEIRRFLQGFSRKGLRRMVEVTISSADQPKSIALRKNLAAWGLEQKVSDFAKGVDAETLKLAEEIGLDIASAELASKAHKERRRAIVMKVVEENRDRALGEVLLELGVTVVPDFDAIAAATWPVVKTMASSAPVKAWLRATVHEFYAREAESAK